MIKSLKPINLILLDTYVLAIIYLAITWKYIDCGTRSNIWQLLFYIVLVLRLLIDQLYNNHYLQRNTYIVTILTSSFIVLLGMCIYECVTIANNSANFDDPKHASPCFQNRILLVGQCIIGFLICIKDAVVVYTEIRGNQPVVESKV